MPLASVLHWQLHCAACPCLQVCVCLPTQIGLKIADLQEQSTAHRKQLADATREFKRSTNTSPAAECAAAAGHLLKQYQEEIDTLTRRAKHGESAFLDLYEQLFEVGRRPDTLRVLPNGGSNRQQSQKFCCSRGQRLMSPGIVGKPTARALLA